MPNIRKVVKKLIPRKLFKNIEPYGHFAEAVLANVRYGFPSRKMHVIGVTGTNGKTTTVFLIHKMLVEAGYKVGMQSTVAYGIGDDIKPQIKHMTTEKAGILQHRLRDFKRAGVEWVVLEASSHSLAQHRNWGPPYEIAVMTNVTHEHLDYHGTFDNYLNAKIELFKMTSKNGRKFGIVNSDDKNFAKFAEQVPRSISYGIKSGDLKATDIKLLTDHSTYKVSVGDDKYDIRVNVPGDFNVSNSLAAVAVGREVGLNKDQIEAGIEALKSVKGRMAIVDEGQKFKVVIDFASTPDAFEKVLKNIRPSTKGKLIIVFGSAGRRDESKRFIQGRIAGKYGDVVVITEEDDRDVDGVEIMKQIAEGSEKAGKIIDKDLFMVHDRKEAINFAMSHAKDANDTVVLLGKGHERTIERVGGIDTWDEEEVAKKALAKLLSNKKYRGK
jgi:UDP-N-acetylmuramoyl-L-alanyl-D-glutamate--2,6-diaminopimelate ligase